MRFVRIAVAFLLGCAAAGSAVADCRSDQPGAPRRKDCKAAPDISAANRVDPLATGRDPGFIDLGQGTEVRIGGRARAEGFTSSGR